MEPLIKTCEHCGKVMTLYWRSKLRKYCDECRKKVNAELMRAKREREGGSKYYYKPRLPRIKPCVKCGTIMLLSGPGKNRRYCHSCSTAISAEKAWNFHIRTYNYKGPFHKEIKCIDCGIILMARSPLKKRCSDCQRKADNLSAIESKKKNHIKYAAIKKIATHRRRVKARQNEGVVKQKDVLALADQQNHRCYYCGASFFINGTLEYYFEIEHKIPISRGGSNDITNVALACRECNARKGIQTEAEFMGIMMTSSREE
jgi:5-methylcytosine-specific restriction endonuclease McrA